MNLIGTAKATQNADFRMRVTSALMLTAINIQKSGDRRSIKAAAAQEVIMSPEGNSLVTRAVWLCAANAGIADTVGDDGSVNATDAKILNAVNIAWDMMFPPDPGNSGDAGRA